MAQPDRDELFQIGDGDGEPGSRIERLFREHNDSLLNFLRARLSSDADAREAAQESYVRLLQLDHPEKLSFLRAYLFKIAANVATDLVRRRATQRRSQQDGPVFDLETPPMQERGLQARQQLRVVETLLTELTPRCREAFLLSRQEGWSTTRIAEHLGVSDRMVRLYLVRALEHLEAGLKRAGAGGVP